jgi:hypothetical protein
MAVTGGWPNWPNPNTEPVFIGPTEWEVWGKLVKSWATGDNRVNPNEPPIPVPRTVQEMKDQMFAAGMKDFHIPARIKQVQFVPYAYDVLVIKLAPKQMIVDGENYVTTAIKYPLPDFYDDHYQKPLPPTDNRRLHDQRVGDYTIRACA